MGLGLESLKMWLINGGFYSCGLLRKGMIHFRHCLSRHSITIQYISEELNIPMDDVEDPWSGLYPLVFYFEYYPHSLDIFMFLLRR